METIVDNTNVLGDISPHICTVRGYVRGHSILRVEVRRAPNPLNLFFWEVEFFSGLLSWKGGKLTAQKNDKVRELMILAGHKPENLAILKDNILDYRLFVFEGTTPQVQILAKEILATDDEAEFLF